MVNPLSVAQQLMAGLICVVVLAIGYFVYDLFADSARLKNIDRVDASVGRANTKFDADSKARRVKDAAYFDALKKQAATISPTGDFDAAARDVYFRVWDDALRGAER